MSISKIIMYFVIYSFLGWAVETIYCSLGEGRFVYRGFLNGPFCPIYGFGAIFVVLFLNGFREEPIILFLASIVITSTLEYITSYIMEKIFHMKWWDYSERKFNINGRVCLRNSTLFGLLSLTLIELIHPATTNFISNFNDRQIYILSNLFLIYFFLDTIYTSLGLLDLKPKLKLVSDLDLELEEDLEKLKSRLSQKREEFLKDSKAMFSKLKLDFSNRRILKSYPNIKSKLYPKSIKNLKTILKNKKD